MSIETPTRQLKLGNIQGLRALAALLVVLSHLFIIEKKYSPDQILGPWAELGMVGVDLFFVISGFIMVYVTVNNQRHLKSFFEFLFARVARIYPLYWFVTTAVLGVWILRPDMIFSSFDNQPDLIKSYLLWPEQRPPLLAVGWTLIHEMFFYFVFAFTLLFHRKFLPLFLVVWGILLSAALLFGFNMYGPVSAILFSALSFEFLLGAFTALLFLKLSMKPFTSYAILFIGMLTFAASLYLAYKSLGTMPTAPQTRVLYFGIPCTLIVYGLVAIETHNGRLHRLIRQMGDWSYGLYLTHILTLSLLGKFWPKIARPGIWDNLLMLPFLTVSAIIVSALTWWIIERPIATALRAARTSLFIDPKS